MSSSVAVIPFSTTERPTSQREARERVGALLREGLNACGMGVTDLSVAIGITRSRIYQIMSGEKPLQMHHVERMPDGLRGWMLNRIAKELGKVIAERVPAQPAALAAAAAELSEELPQLLQLAAKGGSLKRSDAGVLRRIGERLIRVGCGIAGAADELERAGTLPKIGGR